MLLCPVLVLWISITDIATSKNGITYDTVKNPTEEIMAELTAIAEGGASQPAELSVKGSNAIDDNKALGKPPTRTIFLTGK